MHYVVTVSFTVQAEDEQQAIDNVSVALEVVADTLLYNPNADPYLEHLTFPLIDGEPKPLVA